MKPAIVDDNKLICPICHGEIARIKEDGTLEFPPKNREKNGCFERVEPEILRRRLEKMRDPESYNHLCLSLHSFRDYRIGARIPKSSSTTIFFDSTLYLNHL